MVAEVKSEFITFLKFAFSKFLQRLFIPYYKTVEKDLRKRMRILYFSCNVIEFLYFIRKSQRSGESANPST